MPNEVLVKNGTAKSWLASGGDAALTLTSLANGAGRVGGALDMGATRAGRYRVQLKCQFATAPTAGLPVEVYLVRSDDNTTRDGNLGSSDAAVSDADIRAQCLFCGMLSADNQNTGAQVASFEVETGARYLAPLIWNAAGQAFTSTAGHHAVAVTPIVTEIQ